MLRPKSSTGILVLKNGELDKKKRKNITSQFSTELKIGQVGKSFYFKMGKLIKFCANVGTLW